MIYYDYLYERSDYEKRILNYSERTDGGRFLFWFYGLQYERSKKRQTSFPKSHDTGNRRRRLPLQSDNQPFRRKHHDRYTEFMCRMMPAWTGKEKICTVLRKKHVSIPTERRCICQRYGLYRSTDNGKSFEEIFSYTKKNSDSRLWFDYNMLLYQKETDALYYSVKEGIFVFDRNDGKCNQAYNSGSGIVNMAYFQENGKTYFIVIENTDQMEKFATKVFYTTDFTTETTVDISSKIVTGLQDALDAGG